MTIGDGLAGRITQGAPPSATERLLTDAVPVGGIFKLGYGEALVLTNDLWVREAGGVPEHCLLLAVAREPDGRFDSDDEEVLLLRVTATAPVPGQTDLDALRAELTGDLVIEAMSGSGRGRAEIVDPYTDERAQVAGLQCQLLGTFYNDTTNPTVLVFGADLDTAYQSSRYRVVKPFGTSLELAVSYIGGVANAGARGNAAPEPPLVEIGRIRYSATQRRARRAAERGRDTAVPVRVRIEDFVANKTAVFGMTRSGKSNTMKVLATEIFRHSKRVGEPIGQLLFDPHGEYAFLNVQDETALAEIGTEYVVRYRLGATDADRAQGILPLTLNLLAPENIGTAWDLSCSVLQRKSDADYIRSILVIDPVGPPDPGPGVTYSPEDRRLLARTRRARLLIWASMIMAGIEPPPNQKFLVSLNKEVVAELKGARPNDLIIASLPDRANGQQNLFELTRDQLVQAATALCRQANDAPGGDCGDWFTERAEWQAELEALKTVLARERGVSGYTALRDLIPFHSSTAQGNYAELIHDQLVAGKIVIVDLSQGSESILQSSAERIIGYLLDRAAERFRRNEPQPHIQLFLEEAHVLFNRDRFRADASGRDPYVRLAKEAAKFKVGMIFATQEVTAVEEDAILNNTSNWIIAHLNNRKQTNELSYYEDFAAFSSQILRSQDKGFVRLKTLSADFTVPMMVRKFDKNLVEEVRREALAVDGSLSAADA